MLLALNELLEIEVRATLHICRNFARTNTEHIFETHM